MRLLQGRGATAEHGAAGQRLSKWPVQPKENFAADSLQIAHWLDIDAIFDCRLRRMPRRSSQTRCTVQPRAARDCRVKQNYAMLQGCRGSRRTQRR